MVPTPDPERLTCHQGGHTALPCGQPLFACPVLSRLRTIAADVSGAAAAVAGQAAGPVTVDLAVRCGRASSGECRLSLSIRAGRIVVAGAGTAPAGRTVH